MFLAYNNLIPSVNNEDNYETLTRKYLNDISKDAPKFLAYIEIYDISHNLSDKFTKNENILPAICSGSLINTQYVLT